MNKIPTAKEALQEVLDKLGLTIIDDLKICIQETIIEHTKLHVEAALKAASENAEAVDGWNTGFSGCAASVSKQSILDAYPLTNIK